MVDLLHQLKLSVGGNKTDCLLSIESRKIHTLVECDIIKFDSLPTAKIENN